MKTFLMTILFIAASAITIHAQLEKFTYQAEKVAVGQVFVYQKSNQDGSNLHWVATYIASDSYLESLKWSKGSAGATLVTAEMDWATFSVKKFVGGNITPDGERVVGAQLDQLDQNGRYVVQFGDHPDTMSIASLPWHSYDFDFASLNLIWPHLNDLKSDFTIHIADVAFTEGQPRFVNKGLVDIKFVKEAQRKNMDCYQYSIDGPGLENRGGTIWLSQQGQHFVEYLIDLPDESAYTDMKFSLDRIEKMDRGSWEAFKLKIAKGQ